MTTNTAPDKSSASSLQAHISGKANRSSARKKRTLIWTLFLGTVLLLAAIAAYFYINRERPIVTLNVAAGPYRSDSFELMKEVADVLERQSDILRLKVIATKDSSQNIALLNQGYKNLGEQNSNRDKSGEIREMEKLALKDMGLEQLQFTVSKAETNNAKSIPIDLATIRSDTPVVANVRMIAELFPDFFQIVSKVENGFFSVRDLEGKRVAIPPFGTDEFRSFWAIGDHYDLSLSGVKWKAMDITKAVPLFLAGDIDAIFTVRSLRDRLLLNLHEDAVLKNQDLTLIEIDQAPAIAVKRPFLRSDTIPKGAFGGNPIVPRRDIISTAVTRTLVTREDLDPELIRELTSILFENRLDLIIRFALASAIQKPNTDEGLSIPLHEGSQQYYDRDQPSFLQENAEPIALMITIAAMLFSGLLALRSRLNSGQKNRMDSYNYMLLNIAEQATNATEISQLKTLKTELYGILETVVRALDTDEVTEEGFQSFSLLWESVREMINDRRSELTSA
ncbi:MAG: TAXI family TRAP transporter solute-binding subunit [Salaquimonas sp.]